MPNVYETALKSMIKLIDRRGASTARQCLNHALKIHRETMERLDREARQTKAAMAERRAQSARWSSAS